MAFGLDNLMKQGTDLGTAYLKKEIADHGNQQPATRPDTRALPAAKVEEKPPMSMKTKFIIGGCALGAGVVLALVLKK